MADTTKAEETVVDVQNGETEVNDPAAAAPKADGEGEAEKANGDATTKYTEDKNHTTEEVKQEGKGAEEGDSKKSEGTHSPDHKRKDTNDHYRDDNKRTRGGGGRGRGGERSRGRGGGGNNRGREKPGVMEERFDGLTESREPEEIRRQVEFYFSDSNLPIDGYLLSMVDGSNNLPVDLRKIHSFKRMRHFQPFSAVVDAVKASRVLDVEEKDNTAYVTRKRPLDRKYTMNTSENKQLNTEESMARSIYAKGFGDEVKNTHLDIEEFFAPYGPTNSIRLRRGENGVFKGSVFVEFADEATQQRFLELDPKPTWGENDKELQIMSKQAYVDGKHQDILDGNVRPKSPRRNGGFRNRGGGGRRDGGNRRYSDNRNRSRSPDRDDWKNRRDHDQRYGNRDRGGRGGGRGGRGRDGGGRGRGGRGKDDRGRRGRDDRDDEERSRSRSPYRKVKDEEEKMPSRAEAEASKEQEKEVNGGAEAAAEGGAESKKRAREEDEGGAAEETEAKKVKAAEVEVEA